jgi:2-polyprenyl-3-methyl-5-hydroxy-6-metoxy-1,4-benzoquinol methylase
MDKLLQFYNKRVIYRFNAKPDSLHDKVIKRIKGKNTILEIGCADGYIGKILKKKGNKVYGIEISTKTGLEAKKYLDKVYIGNIETDKFPLKKKSFDIVLLMDVLEHLFNPLETLKKIKPYIKEDGMIIVTLPNVANWEIRYHFLQGKFDYDSNQILETGHIRFFTFKTASELLEKAGFEIISTDFVTTMPLLLLKIHNRFTFLGINNFLNKYHTLFAYQYIFLAKKR